MNQYKGLHILEAATKIENEFAAEFPDLSEKKIIDMVEAKIRTLIEAGVIVDA
jgi:hypothetical protein